MKDSTYQILKRIKERFRCVHCDGVQRPHIFCHYCNNTGMWWLDISDDMLLNILLQEINKNE